MRRRIVRATLVAVIAMSGVAYAGLEKRVTVRVDGRPVALRTFAFSVGDALRRAGLTASARDRVEPALASPLVDGAVVSLFRAKPLTLVLDGESRPVVVTGLTVDDAIKEVGLEGTTALDVVAPPRATSLIPGSVIVYRRAVRIGLVYDGKRRRLLTNATTVAQVLKEAGVDLGRRDIIRPGRAAAPRAGMTVQVLRVGVRIEVRDEPIASRTVEQRSPRLEYGLTRVTQEGRDGVRELRYRSTYVDGVRVSRRFLGSHVALKPLNHVIGHGAWFPRCRCSRGSQSGKATWYGASGLTAAHRSLPFGTVVRVTDLATGRSVTVVIRDRGPYGAGRVIDLSPAAFGRLAPLGKGVRRVRLRW